MKFKRTPYLTRVLLAGALLAPVLLSACSMRNPFGGSDPGYNAPRQMGRGECSSQVVNLSGRSLEVYFFLGLQNPPRNRAAWPRLGVLEPLSTSVISGDCEHLRIRIRAYATGPIDRQYENSSTSKDMAWVKGRREIIRLRLAR
jgi:hypothetical protein